MTRTRELAIYSLAIISLFLTTANISNHLHSSAVNAPNSAAHAFATAVTNSDDVHTDMNSIARQHNVETVLRIDQGIWRACFIKPRAILSDIERCVQFSAPETSTPDQHRASVRPPRTISINSNTTTTTPTI